MARNRKPPQPRLAEAPEIDGLGRLVDPENRQTPSPRQAFSAAATIPFVLFTLRNDDGHFIGLERLARTPHTGGAA